MLPTFPWWPHFWTEGERRHCTSCSTTMNLTAELKFMGYSSFNPSCLRRTCPRKKRRQGHSRGGQALTNNLWSTVPEVTILNLIPIINVAASYYVYKIQMGVNIVKLSSSWWRHRSGHFPLGLCEDQKPETKYTPPLLASAIHPR